MKTKPSTEYALMGALMRGPRHGYEIQQFLETALGSTWHVGMSQIYAVLKRLEEKGFLRSSMESQETRPSRRVFSIMPGGEAAFLGWLHRPAEHVRDLRIEFLAKLFFFRRLSLPGGAALVAAQAGVLDQQREKMVRRRREEKDPFNRLVLAFKIATVDAWRKWLIEQAAVFIGDSPNAC